MTKKVGFISSVIVAITVFLFAVGMIIGNNTLSYAICLILSWAYVMLACSFAANAPEDRKVFAYGGMAFAIIYAVFINLVYFTQLTTIAHQSAAPAVLASFDFQNIGSWIFNFDLFGYGMMAISTFMIGMTMIAKSKPDKWLKNLLLIHGVFAISCTLLPILNVFNADMGGSDMIGTFALLFWCVYFIPIGVLSAVHFKK